jgi:hypothetical protein
VLIAAPKETLLLEISSKFELKGIKPDDEFYFPSFKTSSMHLQKGNNTSKADREPAGYTVTGSRLMES